MPDHALPRRFPASILALARTAVLCLLAPAAVIPMAAAQQAATLSTGTPQQGAPKTAAQRPAPAQSSTGFDTCKQWVEEKVEKNHIKLTGSVECTRGDMHIYADEVESWTDTHKAIVIGHVTFTENDTHISAERAEINTQTKLGTFHKAYGFATLAESPKKNPMGGQEPDIYFYGDTIQKVGKDRYKITRGGFTSCLQPVPRWQITSDSIRLRLDHYAFLHNAVVHAKGVPVLYLPALYYPVKKGERATGFLMPVYGTSTYRGFTLSNAFFWAINRSQDATFMHDWFAKRGQGMGVEYRYVTAPGSTGTFKVYRLNENSSSDDTTSSQRSYQVQSNVSQALGSGWYARSRVYYFSSQTAQQNYNTDIYASTLQTRTMTGSVGGPVAGVTVNAAYERTQYFSGGSSATTTGAAPRLTFSRNERPLFGQLLYYSVKGEYVRLVRETETSTTSIDNNLARYDFSPTLRIPFTKLPYLTVNSSISWRDTHWSRSLSDTTGDTLDQGIGRRYFTLQSQITGPVFNRVWSTPGSGFAEKWKHSVEPYVNIQRVTAVDNFDRIVKLDANDYVYGGTTSVAYGINNRFLAKRRGGPAEGSAREVVSIGLAQTYYSDPAASQYDSSYSSSYSGEAGTKLSPIQLSVRVSPQDQVNGTVKVEYNQHYHMLESISANGQVASGNWVNVTAGYSQRRSPSSLDVVQVTSNYVTSTTNLRTPGNRVGGSYTFHYDISGSSMLNSRLILYYNAQCCGFAVEYQNYNLSSTTAGHDRRLNFSFTLAGLGTFSNFFGAMGNM